MRTLVQRLPSLGDPRVMAALPVLLGEVLLGLKELRYGLLVLRVIVIVLLLLL